MLVRYSNQLSYRQQQKLLYAKQIDTKLLPPRGRELIEAGKEEKEIRISYHNHIVNIKPNV